MDDGVWICFRLEALEGQDEAQVGLSLSGLLLIP